MCVPNSKSQAEHTTCDPATESKQQPLPHILFVRANQRPSQCQGLKILLKPVLENTTCHKSFKLFKSSEQLYNSNAKILFGSLTFKEKLVLVWLKAFRIMLINYRIVQFEHVLLLKVGCFWELCIILAHKDVH